MKGVLPVRLDAIAMTNRATRITPTRPKSFAIGTTDRPCRTSGVPGENRRRQPPRLRKNRREARLMDEDRCRVRGATCILLYASATALSSPFPSPLLPLPPHRPSSPSSDVVTPHILPLRLNILRHVWRSRREHRKARQVHPAASRTHRQAVGGRLSRAYK